MASYRFSNVVLENWKNFPTADVDLKRRVFIVGRNAIGKTNFIDVFRFLRDLVLAGGGLAMAVHNRKGITNVRSRFARKNTDVKIMVRVEDKQGKGWEYSLTFNESDEPDPRVPSGKGLVIKHEKLFEIGIDKPKLRKNVGRSQTLLENEKEMDGFEEFIDFLASTTYLHLVPQMVRENQNPLSDTIGTDPYGRGLLDQIMGTATTEKKRRLKIVGDILEKINPQFSKLEQTTDKAGRPHLKVLFKDWRRYSSSQDEQQFSDGTLRLIGLLWVVQESRGTVLLEEPELSLHSGIAGQLAPFLAEASRLSGGRQVIVATHSEALMADEGIRPSEILLVQPSKEGSTITEGAKIPEVNRQLLAGMLASQVVLPIVYDIDESPILSIATKGR